MEVTIDLFRKATAYAIHLAQLVDCRGVHFTQSAEVGEQALTPLGADSGNLVQR